jgi:hypothetical protein
MISPASNQKPEPVPVFSLFRAAVLQPDEECECSGQGCDLCDEPWWYELERDEV